MSKPLKIILSVCAAAAGLIVLAAILAVVFFPGEKIKSIAEEQASTILEMPVSIGKIGLTFAGIPAVKVSDILIGESRDGELPLFSVRSVRVRVNLIRLLRKQVEIVSAELDSPAVAVINYKDGTSNLPPKKAAPEEADNNTGPPRIPLPVTLKTLAISDAEVVLNNRETTGSVITAESINAVLKIDVTGDLKQLTSTGKTTIGNIILSPSDDAKSISGIGAEFIHQLSGDLTTGNFDLTEGGLSVNGIPVSVTATVEGWTKTSFSAASRNLNVTDILNAFPEGTVPDQDKLTAAGTVSFEIEGTADTAPEEPVITYSGSAHIDIASLAFEGFPKSVDSATSHIAFTEEDIDIRDTEIIIGGSRVSLTGTVTGYAEDPAVTITSQGNIDLSDIVGAFPMPEGVDLSGAVEFSISMNGTPSDLASFSADGGATLQEISATVPETLKNPAHLNGRVSLTPAHISVETVSFRSGKSDVDFRGKLTNYMTLAGIGEEPAHFTGSLQSNLIDLNDLLVTKKKEDEKLIKPWDYEETLITLPIPPNLSADMNIALGTVVSGRLKSDSVKGHITFENGVAELKDMQVSAYMGTLTGTSTVNFADPENVTYGGDFNLRAFDSASFIADFLGVGEIFRGKLSSSLTFSGAGLDSVSMLDNLRASGDMAFDRGQIVNLDFTKKLGEHLKFLNFETLDFDSITNSFRVENQKFITPDMALQTSYGDILVDGFTGFDTSVDYRITLNLNKQTSALALKNLSSLTQYLDSTPDRLELNVTAGGTLFSPSFGLDTSAAEEALKASLKDRLTKEVDTLLESKDADELKEKGKKLFNKLFKR